MTARVIVKLKDQALALDIDVEPPLGWRFWTFAGFPQDPVAPRPYGGSRGVPLAFMEDGRWLTAMELDGSAQLFMPHALFPCENQEGAAEFGRSWVARHLAQPRLL